VWRKIVFDICFTGFGTALTTIFRIYNCWDYFPFFQNLQWLITGCVAKIKRNVSRLEQELSILPEHLSSHPVFSGISIAQSSIFCQVLCRSLFLPLFIFLWPLNVLSVFDLPFWLPFGVSKLFLPLSYSQCIIALGRKNRPRCIGQNCRWMNRLIPTSIPRKHTTGELFYHGFKFSKKCICYAQTIYCSYKLSKMCSTFIDY
jgi:hypothetical protein